MQKEKDAYYFSHDSNSRNDEKLLRLRMSLKWEGYGLFWAIVEKLREGTNYQLTRDYNLIAFDLRTDASLVKSIIENFGLFSFTDDGKCFYSERLLKNMDFKKSKSDKARDNAHSRWGENEARKKATKTIIYVIELFNETESFIKVGVTSTSISRRYSGKLNGYKYRVLFQHDVDAKIATECERECDKFKSYNPMIKFAGYLECYKSEDKEEIIEFISNKSGLRNAKNQFRNAIKVKESKVKERKVEEYVLSDIDSLFKNYLLDKKLVEAFCGSQKINPEKLESELKKFNIQLKSRGEHAKTEKDYRSHFLNWFRKQGKFEVVSKQRKRLG